MPIPELPMRSAIPFLLLFLALPLSAQEATEPEATEQTEADDALLKKPEDTRPVSVKELIERYKTVEEMGYTDIRLSTTGSALTDAIQTGSVREVEQEGVLVVTVGEDNELYVNDKKISRSGLGVEIEAIKQEHGKVSVLLDGSKAAKQGVLGALGVVDSFDVRDVAVMKLNVTKEF